MVARTVAAGPVLRVQQPPAMVLNREPIDADGQSVNQIICHQPKTCDMFGRNSPHKKLPFLVALSRVTFTQNSDILSSCYSLQVKSYTARFSPEKSTKKTSCPVAGLGLAFPNATSHTLHVLLAPEMDPGSMV